MPVLQEETMTTTPRCIMFGDENAEGYNALISALMDCGDAKRAHGVDGDYVFLEHTPKTSLIVELYDALLASGYKIVKI